MINIFDDIIPVKVQQDLYRICTLGYQKYNFTDCTSDNIINHKLNSVKDTPQFVFLNYHKGLDDTKDPNHYLFKTILYFLENQLSQEIDELLRIKTNILLKNHNDGDFHNTPHYDLDVPNYKSVIYYVNDSDGPTYFFDNEYNVIEKVYPKQGRMVLFDSETIHAGSNPVSNDYRIVINYIFGLTQ